MYSFIKKRNWDKKPLIYELKTILEQNNEINYINKFNEIFIKKIKIKLALWLAPPLSPKEMSIQTLLHLKWWLVIGERGAKGKKQKPKLIWFF